MMASLWVAGQNHYFFSINAMNTRYSPLLLFIVLLLPYPSFGDTLVLNNGRSIRGTIVGQENGKVTIKITGGTVSFKESQIKEIQRSRQKKQDTPAGKAAGPSSRVQAISPGEYEAYNKFNRVFFVETSSPVLTDGLIKRVADSSARSVDGRLPLKAKTRVRVMNSQVLTRNEKRSDFLYVEGNMAYYSRYATDQVWKYCMARITVLEGPHAGKVGWIKYSAMKIADAQGNKPKKNYFTSYLRPAK